MMDTLIKEFPQQLKAALAIGEQARLTPSAKPLHHVLALGMGGSGIGANFAAEFVKDTAKVPFLTCKGYDLPAFVGENSLVIASSYSGNTEETLQTAEEALARGAKVVCIASGGKLVDWAAANGLDCIKIPNFGAPPRACLGYSLIQQLYILRFFGLAPATVLRDVQNAIALLEQDQELIHLKATKIARFLVGKFPIIYATERCESIAVRLRQQLNENAKILCSHHVIPEMNHNELVGWRKQPGDFAVLIFRSEADHHRNLTRIAINKEIIGHFTDTLIEVVLKGDSLIEQALYGVHLGDWVSWELSKWREVDAMEVKVIDYLKEQLASVHLGEQDSE